MLALAPMRSSSSGDRSEYETATLAWPEPMAYVASLPPRMIEFVRLTCALSAGEPIVVAAAARLEYRPGPTIVTPSALIVADSPGWALAMIPQPPSPSRMALLSMVVRPPPAARAAPEVTISERSTVAPWALVTPVYAAIVDRRTAPPPTSIQAPVVCGWPLSITLESSSTPPFSR